MRELAAWLEGRAAESAERLAYERAVVTRAAPRGMGDRHGVCWGGRGEGRQWRGWC